MISELRTINKLLDVSKMAKVLGVSRPSIYAWMVGSEPNNENALKIHNVAKHVKAILEVNKAQKGFDRTMTTKDQLPFNVIGVSCDD